MIRRSWLLSTLRSSLVILASGNHCLLRAASQPPDQAPSWRARDWNLAAAAPHPGWVDQPSVQGAWAYIDFWASWCAPCRLSFPFMNELQARYAPLGLKLYAISVDKEARGVAAFLRQNPAEFKILWDPEGLAAKAFQVPAMPSSFLINPQGRIVMQHPGFRLADRERLTHAVGKAMEGR